MTPEVQSLLEEKPRARTPLGLPSTPYLLERIANSENPRVWALNHPEQPGPSSPEKTEQAQALLALLPRRQSEVVSLIIMAGLPRHVAAEYLGLDEASIRKYLSRGLAALKQGGAPRLALAPCGTKTARKRHKRRGETCEACVRHLKPCGTLAAESRHRANGERPCDLCRKAKSEQSTRERARKRAAEMAVVDVEERTHRDAEIGRLREALTALTAAAKPLDREWVYERLSEAEGDAFDEAFRAAVAAASDEASKKEGR